MRLARIAPKIAAPKIVGDGGGQGCRPPLRLAVENHWEFEESLMTDKNIPWTGDFRLGSGASTSPAEQAFLRDAERIAEEVAGMSDESVAAYLKAHDLEYLVAPERVDALLASAMNEVRQRRQTAAARSGLSHDSNQDGPDRDGPRTPPFAMRRKDARGNGQQPKEAAAAGNVLRPTFGAPRKPAP